jgi:hypothetical protein
VKPALSPAEAAACAAASKACRAAQAGLLAAPFELASLLPEWTVSDRSRPFPGTLDSVSC